MTTGYIADACALIVFLASRDPAGTMPRATPIMRSEQIRVSTITVW